MRAASLLIMLALVLTGCAATLMAATPATPVNGPELPKVAPPSFTGIGEFSLGMPIAPLVAKLGTADHSGKDSHGGVFHAFKIKGGYMVLLTAPGQPDIVYGVQITGDEKVDMAPFGGVRLGDREDVLRAHFGLPDQKLKETGNDLTLWTYAGRNYSFETTSDKMLASIQIYGYEGLPSGGAQPVTK